MLHGSDRNKNAQKDNTRSLQRTSRVNQADINQSTWLVTQYHGWHQWTAGDYEPDFRCVGIYNNSAAGGTVVIDTPNDNGSGGTLTLYLAAGSGLPIHVTKVYGNGGTLSNILLWK